MTDSRGRRLALAACAACALVLAAPPHATAAQSTLRVAAYNIRHGRGGDGEVDLERIAEVLRELDADVITLQEVDDRTERTGGVDQVARLADLLGHEGFHGPHRPYQGGWYGNAVLARVPIVDARTHPIPPASGSALSVLEVGVEAAPGTTVSVVSVHLAGSEAERLAQADSLTRWFAGGVRPVVLAGDFNDRPDGPVLERLRRDWWVLEKVGSPLTFPADDPDREIDFVMVSPGAGLEVREHRVVEERVASDHRPILAELRTAPRVGPTADTVVPVHEEPRHRLLHEDPRLRVLDIEIEPGDTTLFHRHDAPIAYVFVSPTATNSQVLGAPWGRAPTGTGSATPVGTVTVNESYATSPVEHRVTGLGDVPFRLIGVLNRGSGDTGDAFPTIGTAGPSERAGRFFRTTHHTLPSTAPGARSADAAWVWEAHDRPVVLVQVSPGEVAIEDAGAANAAPRSGLGAAGDFIVLQPGTAARFRVVGADPVTLAIVEVRGPDAPDVSGRPPIPDR
jgi:endonuclease/exonuclease/phosphatase family metal-dependent hydrolase/quercetin dioxygenase-like cupin family protein